MTEKAFSPGLAGVIAGASQVSQVDPEKIQLVIRGYLINDLAEHASYEEVAYLLIMGELPTRAQLAEFQAELAASRDLPEEVSAVLRTIATTSHPMDVLRTGVSMLSHFDPDVDDDSPAAGQRKAKRLISRIPTIIAAGTRLRQGQDPVAPRADFGHAKNFLYMTMGAEPDEHAARTMDVSLTLYAEHGFNASTFTARVITSTRSDLYSAVCGAIGALKGPLHGGANEKAMELMLDIGEVDRAEAYIKDKLAKHERIMGFGHRIYRKGDSRVPILSNLAKQLGERLGNTKWTEMADVITKVMAWEKNIVPNVDFPCSYTYYLLGLPLEIYTPVFAAARVAGWSAHIIEQHEQDVLIRPGQLYDGPAIRPWVPISQRG